MLKAVFYLGLTAVGIVAALFSPLAGAIACIEAYLLIPRPRPVERVSGETSILWLVWTFLGICALSAAWAEVTSSAALDAASDLAKTVLMATALLWAIRSEADLSKLMTAFLVGVLHA